MVVYERHLKLYLFMVRMSKCNIYEKNFLLKIKVNNEQINTYE